MEIPLWRSLLFFALLAIFGIALFPTSRELGLLYVQNKSLEKARSYLARQFYRDPNDIANSVRYLETLLYDGEYHRFEELLSKLLKKNPNNQSLHLIGANYFESVLKMKEASQQWEWLLKHDPADRVTRDKLLSYYALDKQLSDYCRIAVDEIAVDPLNVYLYADLGNEYLHLGKTQRAERVYLEMKRLFPSNPEPFQRLAEIYEARNQSAQALDYYHTLVQKFPQNDEFASTYVDRLLRYKKPEAKQYLEKYVKQFPNQLSFAINLAGFYQKEGKKQDAIKLLEKYSAMSDENPDLLKSLADLYFDNKQYEKSLQFLERYHEKTGGDYHSHHVLGDVLVALGQRSTGRDEYRKALQLIRASF